MIRIGQGYDVHRFVENRKLVLGGVEIPSEFGLLGHSDADVLTHAICDALLGAAAMGDLGKHFPDNNPKFKDICSLILLQHVESLVRSKSNNCKINNIDATIIAQSPKMAPYIQEMRKNIADTLELDIDQVSIKATTEEGLGFTGRKEGIAAMAVAVIDE